MKITKKLMIAAGLFFQLSNLQADLDVNQKQSFNDALGKLNNPQADSLSIKDAKAKVDALNIQDAAVSDSLKLYLTTNTITPSSKKAAFPKADLDSIKQKKDDDIKKSRPVATPAQEDTRDADLDAANERADKAEAAQQEAENKVTQLEAKFAALEKKVAESDSDIKKLVDAAKDKHGADKYIPLAQKAAESLKAAIESINDATEQEAVRKAVQAVLAPQAPAAASAQSGVNLGRLGKKARRKA
ncbi:hypothetical protein [Candidatus Chromulinivorax destructor]|uniref:Uncharacterized protein n=1 Tax=Candidatus Chromulinivorax destructor TaxID=2066483 RepID=A0A345ZBL6_9BACT|nr:hypothetical protein [Candidatus Chromulinivorax destructor]AXK60683.1 hypothetical protein C0J27_02925 [Candidatus Chromulinivorax destructor]